MGKAPKLSVATNVGTGGAVVRETARLPATDVSVGGAIEPLGGGGSETKSSVLKSSVAAALRLRSDSASERSHLASDGSVCIDIAVAAAVLVAIACLASEAPVRSYLP